MITSETEGKDGKVSQMKNQVVDYFYSSPIGLLKIQFKEDKLYSVSQVRRNSIKLPVNSRKKQKHEKQESYFKKRDHLYKKLKLKMDGYFSGEKIIKWEIPFYPRGTDFQNKVWSFLRKIPYGKTYSYLDVSKAVGSDQAMRAVGSACGKNPWLILTPCHRVTAKTGLGGFALGLKTKTYLLKLETKNLKRR